MAPLPDLATSQPTCHLSAVPQIEGESVEPVDGGSEQDALLGQQDALLGFAAVVTACFSSGFAGVFYERLVKHSNQPSVIIR